MLHIKIRCLYLDRLTQYIHVYDKLIKFCILENLYSHCKFSPGTLVSSTNKNDRHNKTEILLKVALNTITLTHNYKIKNKRM